MSIFFVYGTLMRGFQNQLNFLPSKYVKCVLPAVLKDAVLVHFAAGFPGIYRKKGSGEVAGEVVFVKEEHADSVRKTLDRLEEYFGPQNKDNMYERVTVVVHTQGAAREIRCETYYCKMNSKDAVRVTGKPASWARYMRDMKLKDAGDDWSNLHEDNT